MSLTIAVHKRFWKSMTERYGTRWIDNYGAEPAKSWVEALDRQAPSHIGDALKLLSVECPQHPPTLPQFEKLLDRARRKDGDGTDYLRGYWRSMIVFELTRSLGEGAELWLSHKRDSGVRLRELLNELCEMDHANSGQRTPGMYERCKLAVQAEVPPT